ncbi:MAG: D-glycero-beta-D-manno-heptose 1-phosphate adenylyltransferase [Planctomycetota bacterium]|jgi:D-beta-D-heptose 7-phosphate kinase/D-beta-D-heptose 1-phosphate adenosyltransferase
MSTARPLRHVIRSLGTPTVTVVGDLLLDRYVFGSVGRVSPEAPVHVLNVESEDERPGGAGSVAAMLGGLGVHCRLVGTVGDDDDGDTLLALLQAWGADVSGVIRVSGRRTVVKTRMVARNSQSHQQVLRVDHEDTTPLSKARERELAKEVRRAVKGCDALVLSDYAKGVLSDTVLDAGFKAAKRAKIHAIVDPKRQDFRDYRGATLITPNRMETQRALNVTLDDPASVEKAGRRLLRSVGLDAALITLDRDGMALVSRGNPTVYIPTQPREVFDVTGAGDMVIAALATALAGGATAEEAARLANVAGGVEVTHFGVVPVTRDELLEAVHAVGDDPGSKVLRIAALREVLRARKARGERVVLTNGCFDVLHVGHIRYLRAARANGDLLVVGLNSDASVKRLKGKGRPVVPFEERAEMLAALDCVDFVVGFGQDTPARLVPAVDPDVLVKGEDWREKGVVGREWVEAHGGRVVLAPLVPGRSTTSILDRIRDADGPAAGKSKPRRKAAGGSRRKRS